MSDHITNEEAAALRTALKQLQVALNVVVIESDEARAEVERLRADLLIQQGCCDGASVVDGHIERERKEHQAEVERLHQSHQAACEGGDLLRAEVERLREVLRDIENGNYDDPMCWRIRQLAREALEGAP